MGHERFFRAPICVPERGAQVIRAGLHVQTGSCYSVSAMLLFAFFLFGVESCLRIGFLFSTALLPFCLLALIMHFRQSQLRLGARLGLGRFFCGDSLPAFRVACGFLAFVLDRVREAQMLPLSLDELEHFLVRGFGTEDDPCGACSRACGMDVDVVSNPNHPECIRCGKCVGACPVQAVSYTCCSHGKSSARPTASMIDSLDRLACDEKSFRGNE